MSMHIMWYVHWKAQTASSTQAFNHERIYENEYRLHRRHPQYGTRCADIENLWRNVRKNPEH